MELARNSDGERVTYPAFSDSGSFRHHSGYWVEESYRVQLMHNIYVFITWVFSDRCTWVMHKYNDANCEVGMCESDRLFKTVTEALDDAIEYFDEEVEWMYKPWGQGELDATHPPASNRDLREG